MAETTNFRFTEVDASYATPAALVAVLQDFQNDVADVMGRHFSVDMANGDVDLDAALASGDVQIGLRYATFRFTGTNTAVRDIIIPDKQRYYLIWNDTAGDFAIRIVTVTSGNVTYNIPAGRAAWVQVDDSLNVRIVKAQTIELEEEGSSINLNTSALDFLGVDIDAADAGGGTVDVTLQPLGAGAAGVSYIDTTSGLYESNVQEAIDRLDERVQGLGGDTLEHIESRSVAKADNLSKIVFTGGMKSLDDFEELVFFVHMKDFDTDSSYPCMEFYNGTEWDRDRGAPIWYFSGLTHPQNNNAGSSWAYNTGTVFVLGENNMSASATDRGLSQVIRIKRPGTTNQFTTLFTEGHNFSDEASNANQAFQGGGQWRVNDSIEQIRFAADADSPTVDLEFGDVEIHLFGIRKLKGQQIGAWELIDEWEQLTDVDGFNRTNVKFKDPSYLCLRIEVELLGDSTATQTQMRMFLSDDGGASFPTGLWNTVTEGFRERRNNQNALDYHVFNRVQTSGDDNVDQGGLFTASVVIYNNNDSRYYKYLNCFDTWHDTRSDEEHSAINGGIWKQTVPFDTIRFRGREPRNDLTRNIQGRVQVWGLRKVPPSESSLELIKYVDLNNTTLETFDEAKMLDDDWIAWYAVGFVQPVSAGNQRLKWDLTDDLGSNWADTENDSERDGRDSGGTSLDGRRNAFASWDLNNGDMGRGNGQDGLSFETWVLFPRKTDYTSGVSRSTYNVDADDDCATIFYGYGRFSANAIDYIRINLTSSNMDGWIALYGIRSKGWKVPSRNADDVVVDDPGLSVSFDGAGMGQALRHLGRRVRAVIQEASPSAVSEIVLTHSGIASFDDLHIRLRGITLSGDDHLELEVSDDFEETYEGASYRFRTRSEDTAGNVDTDDDGAPSAGAAVIRLTTDTVNWEVDSAGTSSLDLDVTIRNLRDSALHKQIEWEGTYRRGDNGDLVKVQGWGLWEGGVSGLNSFRIRGNASGTTLSGKAILFGGAIGG